MRRSIVFAILAILLVPVLTFSQTATNPPVRPYLSPMRITKLMERTFAYVSLQTQPNATMQTTMRDHLVSIQSAMQTANVAPTAGPVFIFHAYDPSGQKPLDLEIGYPVADGTTAIPGLQVGQLDSSLAATAIYTGPLNDIGSSIGRLIGQVRGAGHTPTDLIRTRSLYYEESDSPNNITLIEIPLQN